MTTLAAFADEIEALTAEVLEHFSAEDRRQAALAVCLSVISHKDTDPKTAGRIGELQQWIARGETGR